MGERPTPKPGERWRDKENRWSKTEFVMVTSIADGRVWYQRRRLTSCPLSVFFERFERQPPSG